MASNAEIGKYQTDEDLCPQDGHANSRAVIDLGFSDVLNCVIVARAEVTQAACPCPVG